MSLVDFVVDQCFDFQVQVVEGFEICPCEWLLLNVVDTDGGYVDDSISDDNESKMEVRGNGYYLVMVEGR